MGQPAQRALRLEAYLREENEWTCLRLGLAVDDLYRGGNLEEG